MLNRQDTFQSSTADLMADCPLLLDVYFQPILDTRTASIKGTEALLRVHTDNGDIETDRFLDSLRDAGQSDALDRWVIEQSLISYTRSLRRYSLDLMLYINISEETLKAPDFHQFIADVMERYEVYPDFIVLEIDIDHCIEPSCYQNLRQLRKTGVNIAVDNIGKGNENSAYLMEDVFDIFKLDKNLFNPSECQMKVQNQLLRLNQHNAEVVAVGVEQTEQVLWCKRTGIKLFQGYFTSQPLPADDFESWFLRGHA